MTPFRYFVARTAQAFGISFRGKHAGRAAAELHLLREAEEILGRLTWEGLEDVEELSMEYWSLRKLGKEFAELSAQVDEANSALLQTQESRATLMKRVAEATKDLNAERERLVMSSEELAEERDAVLREARLVKRNHDGIKAKIEVLLDEGQDNEALASAQTELTDLKRRFKSLRDHRNGVTSRIDELDSQIEACGERIETRRNEMREKALGNYQDIGKTNRDISRTRARQGTVESEMIALFREIGHHLSLPEHSSQHRRLLRPHQAFIGQIQALRVSINLNSKLSGRGNAEAGE